MMILTLKPFSSAICLHEESRSFLSISPPAYDKHLAGRLSTDQNRDKHGTLRMATAFKAQLKATVRE
jgi:hypothetical protein